MLFVLEYPAETCQIGYHILAGNGPSETTITNKHERVASFVRSMRHQPMTCCEPMGNNGHSGLSQQVSGVDTSKHSTTQEEHHEQTSEW